MIRFYLLFLLGTWISCNPQKPSTDLSTSTAALRPNIILLVADDLGYGDLSCYGQKNFLTPNIDKLAAEGMRFTRHYAGTTVCAPSRSSLVSGFHTGHTFIRGNKEAQPEGQYPIADSVYTIFELAKSAGYTTGGFGKWGLGGPETEGEPLKQGIDRWYGYNCQRLAHNYYPEYLWDNDQKVVLTGNAGGKSEQYSHDLIHAQALDFIQAHRDTSFFLYLPYTIPHAEMFAPDDSIFARFRGKFPEIPFKGIDEGPTYRKGPYGSQKFPRAAQAAMITRLDKAVGDIRGLLESLGIEKNTLIVFSSDNGPHKEAGADPVFFNSNGGLRGIKRDLYEGGIRVPLIAYWPGTIRAGLETDHVSAFWDFLPTLAELTGGMTPACDGISYLPELLTAGEQKKHSFLYWEFHEQGGKQAVLLEEKWKGVRLQRNQQPEGPIELYNLEQDPAELYNLAEQNPDIVNRIAQIMRKSHTPSPIFPLADEVQK